MKWDGCFCARTTKGLVDAMRHEVAITMLDDTVVTGELVGVYINRGVKRLWPDTTDARDHQHFYVTATVRTSDQDEAGEWIEKSLDLEDCKAFEPGRRVPLSEWATD